MVATLDRTPPAAVLAELRREAGFGCPVPGCRNPYLAWHHFDPPWRERKHHDPAGMIALCLDHHARADGGAYSVEQLRDMKKAPHAPSTVGGEFAWRRRELLAVVGGNFYYKTPVVLMVGEEPVIWFNKDEQENSLLNLTMLSTEPSPKLVIRDNFWVQLGTPADLRCPPSGKLLHARYSNGDKIAVAFRETTQEAFERRYRLSPDGWGVPFPITTVEVTTTVAGTGLRFGPRHTDLPIGMFTKCFFSENLVAIKL